MNLQSPHSTLTYPLIRHSTLTCPLIRHSKVHPSASVPVLEAVRTNGVLQIAAALMEIKREPNTSVQGIARDCRIVTKLGACLEGDTAGPRDIITWAVQVVKELVARIIGLGHDALSAVLLERLTNNVAWEECKVGLLLVNEGRPLEVAASGGVLAGDDKARASLRIQNE